MISIEPQSSRQSPATVSLFCISPSLQKCGSSYLSTTRIWSTVFVWRSTEYISHPSPVRHPFLQFNFYRFLNRGKVAGTTQGVCARADTGGLAKPDTRYWVYLTDQQGVSCSPGCIGCSIQYLADQGSPPGWLQCELSGLFPPISPTLNSRLSTALNI